MRGYPELRCGGFLPTAVVLALVLLIVPACGDGEDRVIVPAPVVTALPVGVLVGDRVVFPQINYYAAAVVPGAFYKVSITAVSDDADLLVFGSDGTFRFLAPCSIDNTGLIGVGPEDCVIRSTGTTLYLAVDGAFLFGAAGFYTIAVDPVTATGLTLSVPQLDALGRWEARIYSVPAPIPDAYTISIAGLTDDADLYVFGTDAFLNAQAACPNTRLVGTVPESCTLLTGGGTVYFVVDGLFSSAAAAAYTALAAPAIP